MNTANDLNPRSHKPSKIYSLAIGTKIEYIEGQEPAVVSYQYEQELAALTSTAVAAALRQSGIESVNFGALGAG